MEVRSYKTDIMMRRSNNDNDNNDNDTNNSTSNRQRPVNKVALVVGGWSPGPLVYLESTLVSASIPIVQPTTLPMPPFPSGSWCCHPKTLGCIGLISVLFWLTFRQQNQHWAWNLVAGIATLVVCRLTASVVVQTSIEIGAQSCLEAIKPYHQNHEQQAEILFVGFSWGGAVIAELVAQQRLLMESGVRHQPIKVLLIAPTTSLVASIIGYGSQSKDSALRIVEDNYYNHHPDDRIEVVHGTGDEGFCPNPSRWENHPNINLQMLRDNHVFFHPQSQRKLVDLLNQLITS